MRDFPLIPPLVERALLLYGCAYNGANDGRHVLEAQVPHVTVVDNDPAAIEVMRPLYPDAWSFVCMDAGRYVSEACLRGARWDLIVADPYGGNEMERLHSFIPRLKTLARDMLVVGAANDQWQPPNSEKLYRSDRYCWWVFTA